MFDSIRDNKLVEEIFSVWVNGGFLMIPLVLLALIIYFCAMELYFYFHNADFKNVKENVWIDWIKNSSECRGSIGEIISYALSNVKSVVEIQNKFIEIRHAHLPRIDRRIIFLSILITVAPLMGLLGTVMGMLTTFKGLSVGNGKIIELVASGISEALITTQTGLIIAIPGYIFIYVLTRKRQELAAFLGHLESKIVQYYSKGEI